MRRLETDDDILCWLNERKRQQIAGEPRPISDVPFTKPDDLSGAGHYWEGLPVSSIQFLASDGSGSVLSTDQDDDKRGALVILACGERFVWVRDGEESILRIVDHGRDGRIVGIDVHYWN